MNEKSEAHKKCFTFRRNNNDSMKRLMSSTSICIWHQSMCNGDAYIRYTFYSLQKRSYAHMQFSSNCAQENTAHRIKCGSAAPRSETKMMLRSSWRQDLQFAETESISLDYFLIKHLCIFLQVKYLPTLPYSEKFTVTPNAQVALDMWTFILYLYMPC